MINLDGILAYKGVYVLSTINERTKMLKGTHYACCLISGPSPVWGVWSISGRFIRFAASRHQIEEAYPKLVWRRKMASWTLRDVEDHTVKARITELEETFGSAIDRNPVKHASKEA